MNEDWKQDAACRPPDHWTDEMKRVHNNRFFPERGVGLEEVRREFCVRCPVKAKCRDYGLSEPHGAWGGLSESQRRARRRGLRKAA